MKIDRYMFINSQISGVGEHYERIKTFSKLAYEFDGDQLLSFRLKIACIYFARAIIELIFEAADKKQLNSTRVRLKEDLPTKIRWFDLIEKIRIHDFHRFGIIPPNPQVKEFFIGGPIKLKAKNGKAAIVGSKCIMTGDSEVEKQRPLINADGKFLDEESMKYITIDKILKDFLDDIPKVIKEFTIDLG